MGHAVAAILRLGYGMDDRGSILGRGNKGISLLATASGPALWPTQPPIQTAPDALILGIKRPGCEADNSTPFSAEAGNAWNYTSTPQVSVHGVVLNY
jgi:hypothetical protein